MAAPVPGKTLFKLKGLHKKIQEELFKYEQTRMALAERYCAVDEEGKKKKTQKDGSIVFSFTDESKEALNRELKGILSVTIDLGEPFKFEEVEKASLTALDMVALDGLVVE